MKNLIIFIILLNIAATGYGQTKPGQSQLQSPPANLVIDGSLREWGDSLQYYNADTKLNYVLANDKDNLYVAIKINDRSEEIRVLNAGLTLSIDTRGKKKDSFSLTFPVGEQNSITQFGNFRQEGGDITKEDRDELLQARLTKLRGIKISGFKDIEGEVITTSNSYGIKAAIDYDANGNLVYETAIPLKFFHDDNINKNEWAFNFKINGITRPNQNKQGGEQGGMGRGGRGGGGGGGRGGHGGGGHGGHQGGDDHSGGAQYGKLTESVNFWEKFYLSNAK